MSAVHIGNMKKENFHIGDKVFAKVKGYPPWPAMILEENGKKFKVKFYGTGEIGQIKKEDLFYYNRNKNKLLKPSKRKDFNDSVAEIEEAILEAGTDGDPNYGIEQGNESVLSDNSSIVDSERSFSKKRKRSLSAVKSEDSPLNKIKMRKLVSARSNNASPIQEENNCIIADSEHPENTVLAVDLPQNSSESHTTEEEKSASGIESNNESPEVEDESDITVKTETTETTTDSTAKKGDTKNEEITDSTKTVEKIKKDSLENDILYEEALEETQHVGRPEFEDFVLEKELEAFIAYGDYVEKHKDIYIKMSVEKRNCSKLQVLPIFIENKCIGIKLYVNSSLDTFSNEYERAVFDKEISEKVINLKNSFKLDNLKESPELYYEDLKETNEEDLKNFWQKKIMRFREDTLEKLKIESKLLEIDSKIKSSLNLDEADPKEAISLLDEMLKMDILPVMLMKHAHVVDMVRRLKKYVGNLESWDFTEDETNTFKRYAEKIRGSALKLHVKFMRIIGRPQYEESFWDHFNDITTNFREKTKDLDEMEFYLLTSWPYSRDNFLKNYFIKDISFTLPSQIDAIGSNDV